MTRLADLEMYVRRAMLISAAPRMSYSERREAFEKLLTNYAARIDIQVMDEGLDRLNEESFKKLRLAEGQ